MQRVHIAIIKDNNTAPTVLTIPDNPTNGDVQKSLYPNASVHIDEVAGIVFFEGDYDEFELRCSLDWWYAPYKGAAHDRQDG